MNRGMPCFEWAPGVQIEDNQDTMEEQSLTVANDDLETGEQEEAVTEQPQLE